ncbi:MAG: hypothetical protein IJ094_06200 [Bacilli bacterium]|nr:hypothetical protein [Bacilli bacterium]
MNKEKVKIKKKNNKLTPITISIVSLGAFLMMFSVSIYPNLMGNSVTESNKIIINYNANGGSGSMKSQKISVDKAEQLSLNNFKYDNYRFNGWRVKRGDNKYLCYIDNTKTYNMWTGVDSCNKYGYVLYDDGAYVKGITDAGDTITLYADWAK